MLFQLASIFQPIKMSLIYYIINASLKQLLLMQSQNNHQQRSHSKWKHNYQVDFDLAQNQVLTIQLKNWTALEYYHLTVDGQFIASHSDMSCFFNTTSDLLYTLIQLFDSLLISENGVIELVLQLTAVKVNKTKKYVFQLVKDEKGQFQMYKQKINILQQQLTAAKQQNHSLIQSNNRKDQLIKQLAVSQQLFTCINQQNPHIYHFYYAYSPHSIRVTKISQNGWANFIGNQIRGGDRCSFKIKINKIKDGSVYFGIGCKNRLNSFNMENSEVISYFCRDGYIYEQGLKRISGPVMTIGQILKIDVDRKQQKIIWAIGQNTIGESTIPIQLRNRDFYLLSRLFWKQDQFQLDFD